MEHDRVRLVGFVLWSIDVDFSMYCVIALGLEKTISGCVLRSLGLKSVG